MNKNYQIVIVSFTVAYIYQCINNNLFNFSSAITSSREGSLEYKMYPEHKTAYKHNLLILPIFNESTLNSSSAMEDGAVDFMDVGSRSDDDACVDVEQAPSVFDNNIEAWRSIIYIVNRYCLVKCCLNVCSCISSSIISFFLLVLLFLLRPFHLWPFHLFFSQ